MRKSSLQPDVLLVTVNEHETQAVLRAFEETTATTAKPISIDNRVYRNLGLVNEWRVFHALTEMGSGGPGAAQQTVDKAIRALRPKAVVAVGVAFGTNDKKQAIGDILLSRQLRLYELQRAGKDIILRGDKPHASTRLINLYEGVAQTSWRGRPVRPGVLLTGEKLIDSLDYRAQLVAFEPEAIGGEMEGGGVYAACHDHKVDWIVIKAICDWADGNKSKNKTARQKKAAKAAAEFALHALLQTPPKTSRSRNGSNSSDHAPPADTTSELQQKLASLQETELCQRILVPLFKAIGYDRVEVQEDREEHRRTMVCWGLTELGDPRLSLVQVSKYRPTKRPAEQRSISELVTQLSLASERPLPHFDGKMYLPSTVYLVTPFSIDTQTLRVRFEAFAELRGRNIVEIIDGQRLAHLAAQRIPNVIENTFGSQVTPEIAIRPTLTNAQLLSALRVSPERHVTSFYVDLTLTIGRPANHELLHADFRSRARRFELTPTQWSEYCEFVTAVKRDLGVEVSATPLEEVETDHARQVVALKQWEADDIPLRDQLRAEKDAIAELEKRHSADFMTISSTDEYRRLQREWNSLRELGNERHPKRVSLQNALHALERSLTPLRKDLDDRKTHREALEAKLAEHAALRPNDAYVVDASGKQLRGALVSKREALFTSLAVLNDIVPEVNQLKCKSSPDPVVN